MIVNIAPGISNKITRKVTEKDLASAFGTQHMPVLATAKIVAFMEFTALSSVQDLLPEGFSSIGTEISLSHHKPVPAGEKLDCYSRLTDIQGRKLIFEITIRNDSGLIAEAIHTRIIINNKTFERMIGRNG